MLAQDPTRLPPPDATDDTPGPRLLVQKKGAAPSYTVPPGLVGDIAQYIYNSAPRPVPEIALVGALGLMAGICGRAYNVSATGLNQYILVLAQTGVGKEAMAAGIERLLDAVAGTVPASEQFMGPAEIASPQALAKYLANTSNSFVSVVGEIGLKLQQLTTSNASPADLGLRRMLLDLYNKSGRGNTLRATIYSDKSNNADAVAAPAFTLLGESTPERFYGSLSEDMVSEGFLPRFTMVEYHGDRPPANRGHASVRVPDSLIEKLAELMAYALALNHANNVVDVQSSPEAQKLFDDLDLLCDKKINAADRDVYRQVWTRVHLKSMKLAALIAVGIDPYSPVIDEATAQWAIQLVTNDATNLLHKFTTGGFGLDSEELAQVNSMIKTIANLVTSKWDSKIAKYYAPASAKTHADRLVPYSALQRRLGQAAPFRKDPRGSTHALRRTVQTLVDRGDLVPVAKAKAAGDYGFSGALYAIANPTSFLATAEQL